MTKRRLIFWSLTIVLCLAIIGMTVALFERASRPMPVQPPAIAGQKAPDKFFAIDFGKRHDLTCDLFGKEPTVYERCKILGFTGQAEEPSDRSSVAKTGRYFDNWLVLEREDGRLAYLPPGCLKFIEESTPKGNAK